MKNLSLILFLFCSISSSAQILEVEKSKWEKVGEVKPGGLSLLSSIQVIKDSAKDGTNLYLWTYSNSAYRTITDIKSFDFNATEKDFNLLYETLKTQISAPKGTEKEMLLGKTNVSFKTIRNFGVSSLTVMDLSPGGGFFYLTSPQLDKLFGKK
jgi:hypothetical protein